MRRLRMFVGAAIALGAIAVIGCGGGGGDGGQVRMLEEQLAAEEAARLAAEQQAAAEEAAKLAAEQKAAAELAAEEAARLAAEQKAAAEEAARLAAEKEAADEAARLEREKAAAELKAAREEIARLMAEAELAAAQDDDDDADDDADPLLTASASTATPTDATATTTTDDTHAGLPGGTANPLLGGTTGTTTTTTGTTTTPPATTTTTPATTTGPSAESVKRAAGIKAALAETAPALQAGTAPIIAFENNALKIASDGFAVKGSPVALSGFQARMLQSKVAGLDGSTEKWAVYTDIERTRGFLEHNYNDHRIANKPGQFAVDSGFLAETYTPPGQTDEINAVVLTGISITAAEVTAGTKTLSKNNGEFLSGSFGGVGGRFECAAAAGCELTASVDNSRKITGTDLSGAEEDEWIFKAGSQRSVAVTDDGFLFFGWWIKEPQSSAGDYDFQLRWGTGGGTDSPLTALDSTAVAARYVGSATGRYVQETTRTITSAGETLEVVNSGVFTATVDLRTGLTLSTPGTVVGSVTGFKDGGTSLGNWAVSLKDDGSAKTTALSFGGSERTTEGDWDAKYVPSRVSGEAPVSAVGYFDAHVVNSLRVSGAFGAKRQ